MELRYLTIINSGNPQTRISEIFKGRRLVTADTALRFPWSSDIRHSFESFKNELSQTLSHRNQELAECYRDLGESRLRNLYVKLGLPNSSFERLVVALQKVADNFYPHQLATCSFSPTWHKKTGDSTLISTLCFTN